MSKFLSLKSANDKMHLELCPSVGGGITRFFMRAGGKEIPLFRDYDKTLPLDVLNFSSFPLTPFCSRIAFGKMAFDGVTYDVGPKFQQERHPNHGDGWTSPWTVEDTKDNQATLSLSIRDKTETPYSYDAEQVYTLNDDGMTIDIAVTNRSGKALPFGTGHHPYFPRNNDTILKVDARKVWTSQEMVPQQLIDTPAQWDFSQGRALSDANLAPAQHGADGSAYLDHAFEGWDNHAEITWPENNTTLIMTADPVFQNFLLFVPGAGGFFCAEPVTNVTDGFNLANKGVKNTGTIILKNGETLKGQMRFTVRPA